MKNSGNVIAIWSYYATYFIVTDALRVMRLRY